MDRGDARASKFRKIGLEERRPRAEAAMGDGDVEVQMRGVLGPELEPNRRRKELTGVRSGIEGPAALLLDLYF